MSHQTSSPETYTGQTGVLVETASLTRLCFRYLITTLPTSLSPKPNKTEQECGFVIDISSSMEGQKVKQVNGDSKQPSGSFFNRHAHTPEPGFAPRDWVWDFCPWSEAG